MFRKVILIIAFIAIAFSLIGCQTVQGLGKDITWIGEKSAEVVD